MRTMRGGGNADVDELILTVCLHHKGHALGDRGSRVIHAEVVDMEVDLVIGHGHIIGEVIVLIRIDPDGVGICIP